MTTYDRDKMPEGPPPQPRYLTHISDRHPAYKFHTDIGKAKNALGYDGYRGARGGRIWEWQFSDTMLRWEWVLLFDIPRGTKRDNLPWNIEKAAKRKEKERLAERAKLEARLKELDGL
jgi:hypothetical protein